MMKPISTLACLLLSVSICFSQDINQAMELFSQNKRTESMNMLKSLVSDKKAGNDALLALTVQEIDNEHSEQALIYFMQFMRRHPDPYPYAYALWNKGIFNLQSSPARDTLKSLMNFILNDPHANATMRAMAYTNLANRLMNENKVSASKEIYNKLGDVHNWSTVGVFENISSSGFNKDFGPLQHPETGYDFRNNIGTNVQWFNIPDARNDRWLDMEFHYNIDNSIIYAQTFLESESARDVTMLLGVSGSVKLWLNDYQIVSEADERNTDFDTYNFEVKLQKGVNRILIQLGSSEISRSNFMLRFCDGQGKIITDFKTSQSYAPYTKAAPYTVKSVPIFAEQYFENELASGKANLLDKLMLSEVYSHNDKSYENRKITKLLKGEAPKNTIISEALVVAYSQDNNNTDLTREIEFIKTNDPESLIALQYRYNDAVNKEDFDEATRLLNRRVELFGSNADTDLKLLNLLGKKKDVENLMKQYETSVKKYPNNVSFVAIDYRMQQDVYKNPKKAMDLLENFLKTNYSEDLMMALANDKMKQNKKQEGFDLLKKMIENKPYATGWYSNMADKYFEVRDYTSSADYLQKAIDLAPYVGTFYFSKGLVYDAAGKKSEAIPYIKKAMELNPNNYEARRKLFEMEGKKDVFKYFRENDINDIFKNSPSPGDYPNDNSIFLLRDMQEVIYPENGASEEKDNYVVKIFNQDGIEAWKEVNIPYNSYTQRLIIDKAEILKKDGSKVQAETNSSQLVFSSLEVGDAIHISYKLENTYRGKLAEHFWSEFSFNTNFPARISRYSILVPANRKFNFQAYNSTMKPEITDAGDSKLYVWEMKGVPAIESESFMPSFADVSQKLVITSIPDWNYVANWYSDLSNVKVKADFEIKEKVQELFKGKEKLSDLEKAKLIYNYIESNYSYSDVPFLHSALTPQRASRTLDSRLGDCKDLAVLFTSMAKEVGLDANLVLVDTRDQGEKDLDLPAIGFNHCIAQLKAGGKNYFIELTDKNLPFGCMPENLINASGLLIPKDGLSTSNASLIKLNTNDRVQNTINRTTNIKIRGTDVDIVRKTKIAGAETSNTRVRYQNLSKADREKQILQGLTNEFKYSLSLKSVSMQKLDKLEDSLNTEFNFSLTNYVGEIAGMNVISLPWYDIYNSLEFVALEKRNFPINLWQFSSTPYDKEVMTVMLPAGKQWLSLPKNVSYTCSSLSYSLTYEQKSDRVIVTREVKYLKDQIPVNEYAAFREVVHKMAEADKKQIAFR